MIKTQRLTTVTYELKAFIEECKERGFKNNDSLDSMKWQRTLDQGGAWFATYDGSHIVGLSGVHPFRDGYRALFRGCQLYSIPGGLTKNHMNCWMFKYHLPYVIYSTDKPIYITTNTVNDASGSMVRLDRLYKILERRGIVDHVSKEMLNGVEQNIWKLNVDTYLEVRGDE